MEHLSDHVIILLAAGSSSRMGKPKQMLNVNGTTLLQLAVSSSLSSQISSIVVVLGANAIEHQSVLNNLPITTVVNSDWSKGMGSSLKVGLRKAISVFPDMQAAMILVCDQPRLTSDHINTMARTFNQSKPIAIASQYNGTVGVPAIFDRSLFSRLLLIEDKAGARDVLRKLEKELITVPFAGGEIDLDTPEDYQRFIEGRLG
jgi:molybdenum cofactor cytidylyltransferase